MRSGLIGLILAVTLAGPAAAAETVTTIPGAEGPGPSRYDKVFVTKFGPKSARRVLVLMPGYYGGAGDFTLDARELVKRVPDLQVWALDRRSQALEDTGPFADALAGRISVQQAFDYYLGWLSDPAIASHYQPLDQAQFAFAKQWGLALTLQDVRRVVLSARRQGKRVILGGHSLGASMTVAYASWDFGGGRAGYQDLDGLVLVDGGLLGSFSTPDLAATKKAVKALDTNGPFVDLLGLNLAWAAGVFSEMGALAALKEPTAPSIARSFPLLPAPFKPPIPATNRGLFGYAFDASTSPAALALIHVQAGTLGPNGDWVDREVTPIERLAQTFGQEPANERVVLPGQAEHRRRRGQRRGAQRADRLSKAAPLAPPGGRPAALRAADRPDPRPRPAWREALHRRLEGPARALRARRRVGHREPPGPADRGAQAQPLPADGRPLPAQAAPIDAVSERGSYAPGASGVVDLRRQGEGRCAVVADPHGATFGVIAGEPPEE